MKKLTLFAVILLAGFVVATGCKKAEKAPTTPEEPAAKLSPADEVPADVISKDLSKTLCKRMLELEQGVMSEAECVTQTQASLTEALKQKPIHVSKAKFSKCLNKIKMGKREEVFGTTAPKGCEFLEEKPQ